MKSNLKNPVNYFFCKNRKIKCFLVKKIIQENLNIVSKQYSTIMNTVEAQCLLV